MTARWADSDHVLRGRHRSDADSDHVFPARHRSDADSDHVFPGRHRSSAPKAMLSGENVIPGGRT